MPPIDYIGLCDYTDAWPDKLKTFFKDHCVDDPYKEFVRDFWDYCKEPDKDGPAIEGWLDT